MLFFSVIHATLWEICPDLLKNLTFHITTAGTHIHTYTQRHNLLNKNRFKRSEQAHKCECRSSAVSKSPHPHTHCNYRAAGLEQLWENKQSTRIITSWGALKLALCFSPRLRAHAPRINIVNSLFSSLPVQILLTIRLKSCLSLLNLSCWSNYYGKYSCRSRACLEIIITEKKLSFYF